MKIRTAALDGAAAAAQGPVGFKNGEWRDVGWRQKSLRPLELPAPRQPFSAPR